MTDVRASGKTAADEEAELQAEAMTEPFDDAVLPEERTTAFGRRAGHSRMRLEWRPADAEVRQAMHRKVNELIMDAFADAFLIVDQIRCAVRTEELDAAGAPILDATGNKVWRRLPGGAYEEDWLRLAPGERENLMFVVTLGLFDWTRRAADFKSDARFAKGVFTEWFAWHFNNYGDGKSTVDARNAHANVNAAEDRYFALFVSWLSERADAVVRSMELLSQRLKDVLAK
jgi:hypothetical protein